MIENEEASNTGFNFAIGYFEAKTNNLRSLLEEFKVHSVAQLNEVQSKEKLELSLVNFFRDDTSNMYVLSLNPLVDKQRRVDLTFSVINKIRLKEGRKEFKKYICVLIRIEKEALYELSYCDGWRFVMIETLAPHLEMTNKQVVTRTFNEMISDKSFVAKLISENLTQALSEVKYQND